MANREEIRSKAIGDVVRMLLFSTQSMKPIAKKDITAITKKANIAKSQDIIDAAKKKLVQGFGFELKEAANKSTYFLVMKDEPRGRGTAAAVKQKNLRARILNEDPSTRRWRGFVSVVLQFLVLHGNTTEKDVFEHQLFDNLDTECFGSRKQIVAELKQQKWIVEEKEQSGDGRVYIGVGPRAHIETSLEAQYCSAYRLVNGTFPDDNDRALQRIAEEKRTRNRLREGGNNRAPTGSQRKSYRERAMGRGRRR